MRMERSLKGGQMNARQMSGQQVAARVANVSIVVAASLSSCLLSPWLGPVAIPTIPICCLLLLLILIRPFGSKSSTRRLSLMRGGAELLTAFLWALPIDIVLVLLRTICWGVGPVASAPALQPLRGRGLIISLVMAAAVLALVFWDGIIRIYLTSIQLGIRWRVLGIVAGWIFPVNLFVLTRMVAVVADEEEQERERLELDQVRASSQICHTRYPLLLVHGIFFRDFKRVNYWGRIPQSLMKNGAVIYYGQQQSAASVEECGKELAERIDQILTETGVEKVNIIAHSKGGLDARAAISHWGMADKVASLTTINTPHRGCIFAEQLLTTIPEKTRLAVAARYNFVAGKVGDWKPDFLAGVTDLTASACREFNDQTPNMPGVLYESVGSYCRKAQSGRFPLNMTYPLVKHMDGLNDGLVSVDSAPWGSSFRLIEPRTNRGISHGDMIDLNRENIPGFDVREFYVGLVSSLKKRGY
ncbi:triacylglycerol lipase [Parascardovia denticolens IPLA 20019]|uniref:esterase/lipase family protein n=1 Tax=Parascardovia denticolens TaxID=78258 RepID=UPI000266B4DD|nr:triacylglycerol lipase [Parascardovia denticolens]EIT88414.1 triacylglycerol lipase [Parascardovia denticolens IPLA 20019]